MFEENLHNVYREIYYLVHLVKFEAFYVEQLAPVERKLYFSYYEADLEKKSKQESGVEEVNALSPDVEEKMSPYGSGFIQ